jgi:ATP-binding cassette, subfamily A (ABC1), member 3
MTTHAMDEAEILSDKLIILKNGKIKCVGSPIELKKMLGKGFKISMICKQENV